MVSVFSTSSSSVSNVFINKNEKSANKALSATASGSKVAAGGINPAGLAQATQLLSDVSTLKQTSTNLMEGAAVLQTANGGLDQTARVLDRMKQLTAQANSGSVNASASGAINTEYQSLLGELNNLSSAVNFNGQQLLNGSYNQNFQTGTSATDTITANLSGVNVSAAGLGLTAGAGANPAALTTQAGAAAASAEIDTAISNLSNARSQVGATLSAFGTRSQVVDTTLNSELEAKSAVADADIGQEQIDFQNSNVLSQLSIASAVHGNQMKASLLGLLK